MNYKIIFQLSFYLFQALSIEYPYFTEERTLLKDDINDKNIRENTKEKLKRNEESSKAGLR